MQVQDKQSHQFQNLNIFGVLWSFNKGFSLYGSSPYKTFIMLNKKSSSPYKVYIMLNKKSYSVFKAYTPLNKKSVFSTHFLNGYETYENVKHSTGILKVSKNGSCFGWIYYHL